MIGKVGKIAYTGCETNMTGTKYSMLVLLLVLSLVVGGAGSVYGNTDELLASTITWKVMTSTRTIQASTLPFGDDFILETDNASVSGSEDILQALDGMKFALERTSLAGNLTVHLILNLYGNAFMPSLSSRRVECCFNMTVDFLVDGSKVDSDQFTLTMTIPSGSGLDYLLDLCGGNQNTVSFANYNGGSFSTEHITTSFHGQDLVVRIQSPLTVVGGLYSELGIPANVGYSTWYKVKKLFE